jgi:hypothetical protein
MFASTGRRLASSAPTLVKRLSSEDLAALGKLGGSAAPAAARALATAASEGLDIKAVLEEKIPIEQV